MNQVAKRIREELSHSKLRFYEKPLVIGGMAMEYYGLRKSGADIDLVICEKDYQALSQKHPEKRKDIYGDMGVVIDSFELWRSIALLDYEFLKQGAREEGEFLFVSIDRLLLMRVCAMDAEKYKNDLLLVKDYYYRHFRNAGFLQEAETHLPSYEKTGGIVFGGEYRDSHH